MKLLELMNNKRIIIAGKGGSGKDHMRKAIQKMGYRYCVSHTSRPKRNGESDGVDYYFVEPEYFHKNPEAFYEIIVFNGWFYGTSLEEFKKSDVLIMTPGGISKLTPEDRRESLIVYIDISEDIRRDRLSERGDSDSVERRLSADEEDFDGFSDYDILVDDPFFECNFDWIDQLTSKKINI